MPNSLSSYIAITLIPLVFGLVVLFKFNPSKKQVKMLLAFSGAFLLGISFLHLLPEVFEHKSVEASYFILGGFFLQLLLEYFSQGIEHGHIHIHKKTSQFPITIFLSLCIHALIEGMPVGAHHHHHSDHSLLYGVILHKIPIAITLTGLLIASGVSRTTGVIALLLFSAMAPLGMLISQKAINPEYLTYVTAFVVGMLLHISTTILFESSEGHKFNLGKFITIVIGLVLSFFSVSI